MTDKVIENKVIEKGFWCPSCKVYWKTNSFDTIDPLDSDDSNLENFEASCPNCKEKRIAAPHYYANLRKMSANATGPRTEKGKERVARNGIKHGLYSNPNHLLYPAKPGQYKECENCPQGHLCKNKEITYCVIKTELLLKFHYAYKTGDVNCLKEFAGMTQAKTMMALNEMYHSVQSMGVIQMAPKFSSNGEMLFDENGEVVKVISAHPLLAHIPTYINTLGFSADQQQMSPAKQTEKDELNNPGFAAAAGKAVMDAIMGFVNAGNSYTKTAEESRQADPVFKQLQNEEISEDDIQMDIPKANPFN